MVESLISLLILVLILGVVVWIVFWALDLFPIDARFKQMAHVLVLLIAVLIFLARALPLIGISLGI